MKDMSTEAMAQWIWATQHPYLYTFIEVSTPTILLGIIAIKVIDGLFSVMGGSKKR